MPTVEGAMAQVEKAMLAVTCLSAGCEGIPQGHCYHFQNVRAAAARLVEAVYEDAARYHDEQASQKAALAQESLRTAQYELRDEYRRWAEAHRFDAAAIRERAARKGDGA